MAKFDYSFSEVSEDKRVRRSEVIGPNSLPEIIGADMRVAGGLRLFPGFKKITTIPGFNLLASETRRVEEIYAFSLTAGTETKIHGFVYRRTDGGTSSFRAYYYRGSTWYDTEIASHANASAIPWSIVVVGRLLYLYVKGSLPVLFYLDPTTFTVVTVEDTGPGPAPSKPSVSLSFNSWGVLYNDGGGEEIPITEFPYFPEDDHGGVIEEDNITLGLVDFDRKDVLKPGNYNFAIQYGHSVTGLKTNLSKIRTVTEDRFIERVPFDRSIDDTGEITINYRSVGVPQQAILTFVPPEEPVEYDQAWIYRSVAILGAGPNATSSILYLDKFVEDIDEVDNRTHDRMLPDLGLVLKSMFDQALIYDDTPPKGGIAHSHGGAVFVSAITGPDTVKDFEGIGEMRWSTLTEFGPDLFPPGNRYLPEDSLDDIICWFEVSGILHGASTSRVFETNRNGRYVVIRSIHEGYGAVSQDASVGFGPATLLVTSQGIKELGANGDMRNVNAFNLVILDEWKASLGDICCALDTVMGVIFVLNPSENKTLCMWTETRQTSELWYTSFSFVTEGVDPLSGNTKKRALFVTPQGAIYRVDDQEKKTFTAHPDAGQIGSTYKTMLEIDGQHFFKVTASSGSTVTVASPGDEAFSLADTRDAWVYFPTQDVWGQVEYHTHPGGSSMVFHLTADAPPLAVGNRVLLSPVFFRVMGSALGEPVTREGREYVAPTRWSLKTAATLGAIFEGVSGVGLSQQESTFRGKVYQGLDATAAASAATVDSSGSATKALASAGGTSIFALFDTYGAKDQLIFPVLEVSCPDVDFVLLSMRIAGSMNKSSENVRA